jgi:hypothetical protein
MNRRLIGVIKSSAVPAIALAFLALAYPAGRTASDPLPLAGEVAQGEKTFDQAAAIAALNKKIAGQENKPAAEVFKNVQLLKAMPAGRLLKVMEIGYAKSLGVTCVHCHVADEWDKDDKPQKQITRDMAGMSKTINTELLKNIKNLKGPNSVVNCTTCHRGQVKPALDLP